MVNPGAWINHVHDDDAADGTEFRTRVSFTSDVVTWYCRSCPAKTLGYSSALDTADWFVPNPSSAA
jgi:hypothetical protein